MLYTILRIAMFSVPCSDRDYLLSSYGYDLPPEQIAQHPGERGHSRLLVLDRTADETVHTLFSSLPDFLPEGALLVANNSRVIPARLLGKKSSGGKLEFLLLTPLPLVENAGEKNENGWFRAEAEGLIRPSKGVKPGSLLEFGENLRVEVLRKGEFGKHAVFLHWRGSLRSIFETCGHLPLPPYIRREDSAEDRSSYQTIYARNDKAGSVAAPTAGLHFTPEMRRRLSEKGFEWTEVTLHVGYGTFSPVRCTDIREHVMHPEFVEVSLETAETVARAKKEGRPVIAVGTTSARTLEGVAGLYEGVLQAHTGWINCFIWPGYVFQVVDGLITNFHLPESTLLMLVSALAGRERMLSVYRDAVTRGYRFFSYGDAMLVR